MKGLGILLGALLAGAAEAGHNDMFSCRGKGACSVVELSETNWDTALTVPHFVMFYAPWCGHCKQLAPTLKKAAKALESSGVKVGAIDVEPNPKVQAKFPDIRGFPTLKFLAGPSAKKAVDYQGGRDEQSIVEFARAEAKKAGVTLGEPVVPKAFSELYTFVGRAAIDRKPALLVVGKDAEAPAWVGKLAAELRKPDAAAKAGDAPKPEAKTKELLREAARATKMDAVRDGVASLLEAIAAAEKQGPPLGPPVVSAAYSADAATAAAFGLGPGDLPALVLVSVDRKTAAGSYALAPGGPQQGKRAGSAPALEPLAAFVRGILPAALEGPAAFDAAAAGARPLPELPKPANVLAAEERERKRKEREGSIAAVASQATLESACYGLAGKSCALVGLPGGAAAAAENPALAALAKQFSKEGFSFAAVDTASAPTEVVAGLLGEGPWPVVAVVKGGKRPRVARVGADGDAAAFFEDCKNGAAKFEKVAGGLPVWPGGSDGISEDEL